MPTRTVELTEAQHARLTEIVARAGYRSESSAIDAALTLLDWDSLDDDEKHRRFLDAIDVGLRALDEGRYTDVPLQDMGDFLRSLGSTGKRTVGEP